MSMRLNEGDVSRIITACKRYQDQTGSEYMFEEYENIIHKLETLCEQGYCAISK